MEKSKDLKELFRAIKFLFISISAGIIQVLGFALFNDLLSLGYWFSYLTSLILSVLWNFTINRRYTFKSANNVKIAMLLVLAFYVVFTPISTVIGNLAEKAGVHDYIVLIVTMLANFVLEFLYTRYVVYRNSCDTIVGKTVDLVKNDKETDKTL